mmetsp:Transcript_46603/g.141166  ORF Transcript_46603/g.141166 Transcript_46603/m.141166 type:complete len:240 (+) Transcript_46603:746-1465(+)
MQVAMSQAIGKSQSESLVDILKKKGIISSEISKLLVSAFSQPKGETSTEKVFSLTGINESGEVIGSGEALRSGRSSVTLVIFGLGFLLLLSSLVVFFVGGTFGLNLRSARKKKESPYAPKVDTDASINLDESDSKIPGVLGAMPANEGDGNAPPFDAVSNDIEMAVSATGLTPRKSIYRRYEVETPESVLSPLSVNTSMASRAPLGIKSVRKLLRTPQKENREKPMYDLSKALTRTTVT